MELQAQVVDLKQYKDERAGGRPCGGALYNSFHPNSSAKNSSSSPPGPAPAGCYWKRCSEEGWRLKKIKTAEQKQEKQIDNVENNIDNLASEKKEIKKKEELEVKKEDELSRIVKNNYTVRQREIMEEINYKRVQNYEELNKNSRKIIVANNNNVCPLCGSKTNHDSSEEKAYSKAA